MELSEDRGLAADVPSYALDCPWNAYCFTVESRQCLVARVTAASFPFPILIVALNCRPPLSAGNGWRYLTASSCPAKEIAPSWGTNKIAIQGFYLPVVPLKSIDDEFNSSL
jgi:hypothetical protein